MLESALLICMLVTAPQAGPVVHIGYDADAPEAIQSLQFRAHDVLIVEVATGQVAMVQFTEVNRQSGKYRWRYRRPGSTEWLVGSGEVIERRELIPEGPGRFSSLPLPGHDPVVRAGDIRAEWSPHDGSTGFFYFHPRKAKVTIAPSKAFAETR